MTTNIDDVQEIITQTAEMAQMDAGDWAAWLKTFFTDGQGNWHVIADQQGNDITDLVAGAFNAIETERQQLRIRIWAAITMIAKLQVQRQQAFAAIEDAHNAGKSKLETEVINALRGQGLSSANATRVLNYLLGRNDEGITVEVELTLRTMLMDANRQINSWLDIGG